MYAARRPTGRLLGALATLAALGGCLDERADAPRVEISVSPLSLTGITGATYTISVLNGADELVWTRTLTAERYGDGQGALTYVGPCDASPGVADNTIRLVLDELRDAGGPLADPADYKNPAPASAPIELVRTCLENADVAAVFDLTIARSAQQGFFDVAIQFEDIFCSAKLDCERAPGQPLELLADATGERALTAVVAFACTAGEDADTYLWMDRVVVTCEGGGPFIVDVADGPGNLDPVFDDPTTDLLFQAAIYRGTELLDGDNAWNKAYWNVALGLNEQAFAALGACTLTGMATATDGPLPNGVTPPDLAYPVVTWNVPLTTAEGERACTVHPLDGGNGVATSYTPTSGHGFYAGLERATGLVTVTGAAPDATSTLTCAATALAVGASTSCTLVARQGNNVITTASGNFQLAALPAGTLSALSPAYGSTFTFTFTATSSGPITLDTGVGATFALTVTDTPDATSTLTCADATLAVGAATTCTITPKKASATIYAAPSAFSPSASAGTPSALSPTSAAAAFTFTYTAPSTSGPVTLSSGLSSAALTVTDSPDASSTLSCADTVLSAGSSTSCTITPKKAGATITALASGFTTSASAGSTTAPAPAVGTSFTFTYTAPSTSGPVSVSNGFSFVALTITDTPDATSTVACSPSSVPTTHQSTCTITPKKAGATIYAASTSFTPSASAGSVSALSPTGVATSFTFTFTAPTTAQSVTVGSGVSSTTVTVTTACNDGVKNGTETDIDCGGSCGACANGKTCAVANDCSSKYCGSGTCAWATSCAVLKTGGVATGEYTIDPDGAGTGGTYGVFCDMDTDSGGWTVFANADVGLVAAVNQAWRTTKSKVMVYLRDSSGNRYTTRLEQLSNYSGTDLQLTVVPNGIQIQFVPNVVQNMTNGFRSNGSDLSFVNCDTNANSYFQFYRAGFAGSGGTEYALAQSWRSSKATFAPAMPTTYFGNVTVAFGGCGAFTHNANFTDTIVSVALGLR